MLTDPKKRKWIVLIAVVLLFVLLSALLLSQIDLKTFFISYGGYLNADIEHKAALFEQIVGGICTGATTFIALFITIRHENRKNRESWEKEKRQESERRLWAVKPVLNLDVQAVSTLRTGQIDPYNFILTLGTEKYHVYVNLLIKNAGNGDCRSIKLMNSKYTIKEIPKSEQVETKLFFSGLSSISEEKSLDLSFQYMDVYGTVYTQTFSSCLNLKDNTFIVKMDH